MSKLINIPGTTSFIPLDDVISIRIHGELSVEEKIIFPETPEDIFKIAITPTVKFHLVTTYVKDSDEEQEEGDTSDESAKVDEVASILWSESDLIEASGVDVELTESNQYTSMDEKSQSQTNIRLKKYSDNIERVFAKSDLLLKLNNINPEASELDVSTVTGSDVEEEEDNTPSFIPSSNQLVFDPDQNKLKEIEDYLIADAEGQEKRIAWLKKHFERSTVEVTGEDGYKFLNELQSRGISEAQVSLLKEDLSRAVEEVGGLINV